MRTLVTGGVRSGKSRVAEDLLAGRPGVTYVATGPRADDPDWQARVAAHRARRPRDWSTLETADLADALRRLRGPALVDCAGTWLTAVLDGLGAWDTPRAGWEPGLHERTADVVAAWAACPHDLVVVTNEVGWGVVPAHHSGRVFADELGRLNQQLAGAADRVLLVVAGRVLTLPGG
ncbi:bifunctional adenosylcobinamide kinase/adenosylcobinamide-phosphate guanylyltransferase [Phycicoccus endophyticus]|uniref:Adenosylcobinamide kinase n=1 Tax=Phycicoccus endophyticus TaxID=1690220 RepID=A0A7G9R3L8_9MICO|nr:bifunctional adenosylcobinamide kinase/adenosylcobinamide-phosphate guanylyltransferase [Phycicoccus endophyticus]NHI19956.1 bifunctional adenosylcobinamide kinase/adenosylcobinamide-phosphate guanylyltransferase [Phycicoccus endophyticus]QNN50193.1 bifunctional adenosylcobinamide kinase/adenosylcobinamide-phosphate guanylyltransferase [Phycicoccus endophyticus]GGL27167.1 adenosylcobinamide kinase [Phycicoccus endophyticus]